MNKENGLPIGNVLNAAKRAASYIRGSHCRRNNGIQIKFKAKLVNTNGKAVKGKKITFKVSGKTYSAKTDKKGIASISFKNLKAGSYRITVGYLKSQVKTTLKVKR